MEGSQSSLSPGLSQAQQAKDLKRKYVPRATQACQMCKKKKIKCDEGRPTCSSCKDRNYSCIYVDLEPKSQKKKGSGRETQGNRAELNQDTEQSLHTANREALLDSPALLFSANVPLPSPSPINPVWRTRAESFNPSLIPKPQSTGTATVISPSTPQDEAQSELGSVGGMNEHTKGREFYGRSSNFALLSQLISKAQSRLSASSAGDLRSHIGAHDTRESMENHLRRQGEVAANTAGLIEGEDTNNAQKLLKDGRFSVVNLLFDEESAIQDSMQPDGSKTPIYSSKDQNRIGTSQSSHGNIAPSHSNDLNRDDKLSSEDVPPRADYSGDRVNADVAITLTDAHWVEIQLEKEYTRIFFDNLHYIHPFLSQTTFIAQCEHDIWTQLDHQRLRKQQSHFYALYNTVIAVGSLTAGTHVLETLRSALAKHRARRSSKGGSQIPTSVDLSKMFFTRAKKSLGDYFEVCSLEGVQALILMSLYSQNALRPHACYMYSGMAVRSALAIGLSDECSTESTAAIDEAKRTWWAVYSQEVDMCCSSGRRSSLTEPEAYRLPLPVGKVDRSISPIDMIPQMVSFAAILLRTSSQLYHHPKELPEHEKSQIACRLDKDLSSWRLNLPSWLNSGYHPFTEPEWAGKQRLVLQLRFYNAKILIHRPLMASSDAQNSSDFEFHTAACLDGARKTIELLYEAYTHRHYFRTWYYNSTYTLYASMLILYVVLINYPHVSNVELVQDVEKSLDILRAMDNVKVAKRCAHLICEVLEVVKMQHGATENARDDQNNAEGMTKGSFDNAQFYNDNLWIDSGSRMNGRLHHHNIHTQVIPPDIQDTNGRTGPSRNDLLATLMDPIALEGFASDANIDTTFTFGSDWSTIDSGSWMDFDMSQNFFVES